MALLNEPEIEEVKDIIIKEDPSPIYLRFSVTIETWSSPREVEVKNEEIWFQSATCYPCARCNQREMDLKDAVNTHKITYKTQIDDKILYFILPVPKSLDKITSETVADYIAKVFNINIKSIGNDKMIKKIYSFAEVKSDSSWYLFEELNKEQMTRALDQLWKQMENDEPKLFERFKNNIYLGLAVLCKSKSIEEAVTKLKYFGDQYNDKQIDMFKQTGIGGPIARQFGSVLNGYNYNTIMMLFLIFDHNGDAKMIARRLQKVMQISGHWL